MARLPAATRYFFFMVYLFFALRAKKVTPQGGVESFASTPIPYEFFN